MGIAACSMMKTPNLSTIVWATMFCMCCQRQIIQGKIGNLIWTAKKLPEQQRLKDSWFFLPLSLLPSCHVWEKKNQRDLGTKPLGVFFQVFLKMTETAMKCFWITDICPWEIKIKHLTLMMKNASPKSSHSVKIPLGSSMESFSS